MGTNYYLHNVEPCPTCGRSDEPIHIGKSSAGWCFALHIDPENGIRDLPDWEDRWAKPGAKIVDEYGDTISVDEMRATILARTWPKAQQQGARFLRENDAEEGPMGLLRHRIGALCVGHGSGTYDLFEREFS